MDIVPLIQKLSNFFVNQPKTIFKKKCKWKGQGPPNKVGIFKCSGGAGVDFDFVATKHYFTPKHGTKFQKFPHFHAIFTKLSNNYKGFEISTKNTQKHRLFAQSF